MTQNISESLSIIVSKTEDIKNSSNTTLTEVNAGNRFVEKLENQAAQVGEINNETVALTAELEQNAVAVKDILATILNISSQTNLLALNASMLVKQVRDLQLLRMRLDLFQSRPRQVPKR